MKPCTKKRYATNADAADFAKRHIGASTYFCPSCKAWHVTTGIVGRVTKAAKGNSVAMEEWLKRKARRR